MVVFKYHFSMETVSIYARQSFDRHGDSLAVARQLDLCREYARARRWSVAAEYVDNDRSATSGRERPEFEALLASQPARILVWHTDRLVRLTRDLERVINLGVNVYAVEAGALDLSNPAGRAVARTVTAWAQYETEQKGLRQRAANDQRAEAGQPYRCQRAFGYERDGVTVREAEAAELRAAAEGVIRGQSLSALCRDLNARGVRTATGKTWRTTTLKAALLSPRNAGQRRHRGEVVGPGNWPAILDAETVAALRAILTDPSRAKRGPDRRYLLSGLMACGVCGGSVVGTRTSDRGTVYRCMPHLSRKLAPIDAYVRALVIERLSRPDALALFTRPGDDARAAELREERTGLRERLSGLAEAFAMGEVDRAQLTAGTRRINARLGAIEGELAGAVADPTLAAVATADDVAEAFDALSFESRRAVVSTLMYLTLMPVGPGRTKADAPMTGLEINWR